MRIFDRVFRLQGVIFNILFAGIAFGIHVIFRETPEDTLIAYETKYWTGIAVLVMMCVETIALAIKFLSPIHRERAGGVARIERVELPGRGWGVLLIGLVHAGASVVLALVALEAVGFQLDLQEPVPMAIVLVIVLKEIYLLGLIILPLQRDRPASGPALLFADVALLVFSAVAYAAVLQEIIEYRDLPLFVEGIDDLWSVLGISAAVFLAFFLPLRLGFVIEETVFARDALDRVAIYFSLLIAAGAALGPLMLM
jgi:predicted neutral ceramidase superfamily lipid hydrolase